MSDPPKPWSDDPYAPQIPRSLYFAEKAVFAGMLVGGTLYGVVIVLFFKCMGVLLSSAYRARKGVRWGLVAYTTISFSFATIFTAINLHIQSISFMDNREFTGSEVQPPGPLGYQLLIYSKPISIVANLMFLLCNWLADGLLLYRCYLFYGNIWVVAFPCLVYLASLAMGIMLLYQTSQPNSSIWNNVAIDFGVPYFSISLSLNILLTLLIVGRLALHRRNVRSAMGARASGLYETIITMLVESCALYAVTSLLFVVPWSVKSHVADIFLPILAEIQVIAPLLIIRRVADQSALTSDTVNSVNSRFKSQERCTNGGGNPWTPGAYCMTSVDTYGNTLDQQLDAGVESTLDVHRDKDSI